MPLYDVSLGSVVSTGKDGLMSGEIAQNEAMLADFTKLKFLQGSVKYEDSVWKREWIIKAGQENMKKIFQEVHNRFGVAPFTSSWNLFEELEV